jgi:hypothetical protein
MELRSDTGIENTGCLTFNLQEILHRGCQDLLRGSCDRGVILRFIDGRKNERGIVKMGLKETARKQ